MEKKENKGFGDRGNRGPGKSRFNGERRERPARREGFGRDRKPRREQDDTFERPWIMVKDNTGKSMAEEMGIGAEMDMLFGMHPVIEAIMAGKPVEKIFFKKGLDGEGFRKLMDLASEKEIPCQFVPLEKLNRLTSSAHQGVVAVIPQVNYVPLEEVLEKAKAASENPIFVMLDGVTDVRNLGAIVRTSECVGVSGVIVPAKGGAAINADAIKASAGALLRMDTSRVPNLRNAILLLKEAGFRIIAMTEKAESDMYDCDMRGPVAIVMGSEGKGISSSVLEMCDEKARIPMSGEIGSLNVSVATAVVLYEVVRQRRSL